jgi:hypothetical protein
MTRGPGPYDPQPGSPSPNPDPVQPGHTPMEVPVFPPNEMPATDPGRSPAGPMTEPDPGPSPIGPSD